MKISTKFDMRLQGCDKIYSVLDHDCPMGQILDFSFALQNFAFQQLKEEQEKKASLRKELEEDKQLE